MALAVQKGFRFPADATLCAFAPLREICSRRVPFPADATLQQLILTPYQEEAGHFREEYLPRMDTDEHGWGKDC
jgi:hypothetical protein